MNETYVYEGVEVQKTGRHATREVKTIPGKSSVSTLVEICPVGDEFSWKKWVNPDHLYKVKDIK
jgi:hypothetical protein